jgi:4-amino-4-deoxy-L-arabinose transferase-like glycosyltransferase
MQNRIALVLIVLLGVVARAAGTGRALDGTAGEASVWRECDAEMIARNFARDTLNPLYPRVGFGGDGPGYVEMEFPMQPWLMGVLYRFFGDDVLWGRLVALGAACWALVLFARLARRLLSASAALAATAFFALNPLCIQLATALQPDGFMNLFAIVGANSLLRWLDENRPSQYWICMAATALAILAKATGAYLGLFYLALIWQQRGARGLGSRAVVGLALGSVLPPALWYFHARSLWIDYGVSLGVSSEHAWAGLDLFTDPHFILGILRHQLLLVWTPTGAALGLAAILLAGRARTQRAASVRAGGTDRRGAEPASPAPLGQPAAASASARSARRPADSDLACEHRPRRAGAGAVGRAGWWWLASLTFLLLISRTTADDWAGYYHCIAVPAAALLAGAGVLAGGMDDFGAHRIRARELVAATAAGTAVVYVVPRALPHLSAGWMSLAAAVAVAAVTLAVAARHRHTPVRTHLFRFLVLLTPLHLGLRAGQISKSERMVPHHACAQALAPLLQGDGLLVVSGPSRRDPKGYPIDYAASYMFCWLDRTGFTVSKDDLTLARLQELVARGARYLIAEPRHLQLGVAEQLRQTYPILYQCANATLFELWR